MRPPPGGDDERRPPGGEDGVPSRRAAKRFDLPSVATPTDNREDSAEAAALTEAEIAADLAIMHAENHVAALGRVVEAMRRMPTPNLRDLAVIGLVDESWPYLHEEMDRRGEAW